MNQENAQKIYDDFVYLVGCSVKHEPGATVEKLSISKSLDDKYYVRVHMELPNSDNSINELIETYCKNEGIEYEFPKS